MNKRVRFFDIVRDIDKSVCLIGCGGIGANTAIQLSKLGVTDLTIFDFDKVSESNVGSQIFYNSDIGRYKVDAIERFLLSDLKLNKQKCRYEFSIPHDVLISGVDSMESRKEIWDFARDKPYSHYIDARMSAESMSIFVVDMGCEKSKLAYEKTLFDDSEGLREACTSKATFYNGAICGALVAFAFKQIVNKQKIKMINFDLKEGSYSCI